MYIPSEPIEAIPTTNLDWAIEDAEKALAEMGQVTEEIQARLWRYYAERGRRARPSEVPCDWPECEAPATHLVGNYQSCNQHDGWFYPLLDRAAQEKMQKQEINEHE